MKNLKKVVALSLAAVMMFGMMVVGAGAASYKDVEDSDFGTAIDVMSSIEIIKGNEGNFNPNGNLCRADALLLVGKIMLGEDGLKALSVATATNYDDVPATAYYAGAVAWATKEGIVAGNGAGKFDPMADMSGIGFAKLLLNALGYNSAVEGYVDVAWSEQIVNINYDAALAGLLKGLEGVDLNKALTREQAAQMAFNAVTSDHRVAYADELGVVNGELTTVYKRYEYTTDTLTDAFGLRYAKPSYTTDTVNGGYWYFVEKVYNEETEEFEYKIVRDEAGDIVYASAPVEVEANVVIDGYTTYNKMLKNFYNAEKDIYCSFDNSVAFDANLTDKDEKNDVYGYDTLYNLTGNGVTVYAWTYKDVIYKIDVAYETLTEVTGEYDEASELYTFYVDGEKDPITFDDSVNPNKLMNAKYANLVALDIDLDGTKITTGHYDWYYTDAKTVASSWTGYALPTVVTGVAETIGKGGLSAKVDGELYFVSSKAVEGTTTTLNDADLVTSYDYYLDSTGCIIFAEPTDTTLPDNFLYITSVDSVAGKWDEKTDKYLPAYSVTGFDLTGAKHTFNVGGSKVVANSKSTGADDKVNVTELAAKQFITYKLNKDGNLVVADVVVAVKDEIVTDKTVALKASDVTFDGKFITANTKFVYFYRAEKNEFIPGDEGYCDIITGAHEIDAGSDFYRFVVEGNDVELVVIMSAPKAVVTPAENLIYVDSWNTNFKYYTLAADGETKLCNYNVYIDGEETTIAVDSKGASYYGWFSYTVDKDGVYSLTKNDVKTTGYETTGNYNFHKTNKYGNAIVSGNGRYYVSFEVEVEEDVYVERLVDITDAEVYNLTLASANNVARLHTLANSDSYDTVKISVQYAQDPVTKLYHAVALYVNEIDD